MFKLEAPFAPAGDQPAAIAKLTEGLLAIVKVLPEPVTPSSVWCFAPASSPSVSFAMAAG